MGLSHVLYTPTLSASYEQKISPQSPSNVLMDCRLNNHLGCKVFGTSQRSLFTEVLVIRGRGTHLPSCMMANPAQIVWPCERLLEIAAHCHKPEDMQVRSTWRPKGYCKVTLVFHIFFPLNVKEKRNRLLLPLHLALLHWQVV